MQYKSVTKVDFAKSNRTTVTSSNVSYITGNSSDVDFTVNNVQEFCSTLTKGTFDSFAFDISSHAAIEDVTSIKAFVSNEDELKTSLNDTRFSVTVGSTEIGETALFEVTNVSGLLSNITFAGVAVTDELVADDVVAVYVIITTK